MKHITIKNLLVYIGAVLTPIYAAIFWLGVLVFFDLITGLIKAYKTKTPITSRQLTRTATKSIIYFMLIIAAQVMDSQFITLEFLPARCAQLAAGFLAVIEFKSILENAKDILGVSLLQYFKDKINSVK